MTEWWTYSLHSFLLFSPRVYWRLIEHYNQSLWPLQIPVLLLGFVVLYGLLRRQPRTWRAAWALLACGWFFVGWGYLDQRYAAINWPVKYMVPVFFLEGLLLLVLAARRPTDVRPGAGRRLGLVLLCYALAGHPLVTALLGGAWSAAELPGLLPDPTAIATLGALLGWKKSRWRGVLMVIPVLWCFYSVLCLLAIDAPAAWVMLGALGLAAIAGWGLVWTPIRKRR
ncbi:DUF6064 family protein [Mangrovitalea sediminis]|uniref:DUF6064 family protein n=1 Tax=Mangrovitalea sediminis TaxID=1982043 RepID=UPI000BE5F21D|nr:DUF6064 family protein [Mangrovitalea sediminis]